MVAGSGINALTGDNQQVLGMLTESGKKVVGVNQQLGKTMGITGDRLDQNVDIEQKSRQMRIAADNALMAVGDLVINMFQKLNDIMYKFAKTVAKVVDFLTGMIPGMKATNYADQFKDADDFKNDIAEANKAKAMLMSDLEKAKADLAQSEKQTTDGKLAQNDLAKQIQEKAAAITDMETKARAEKDITLRKELNAEIAKQKRDLNELNYQARDTSKNGKIDNDAVLAERKKRVADLEAQNAATDKEILEAKKKLNNFQAGSGAAATGPQAGSPGYMAKYNPGGAAASGMAQTVPNANASGPPDLGNKTIEDIIKFSGGTGDVSHFRSMDPNVANAFTAMAKEYFEKYGKQLQINSAYRSVGEQAAIAASGANGSNPVAKPGQSLHNVGRALDINSDQVQALLSSGLLQKYGFQPLQGDPPHIQYGAKDGGVFDGPDTGYPVMLHGNEAVIPMPNLQDFTDSVKKENLETIKGMDTGNKETIVQKIDSGISPEFMESLMSMMVNKFDEMIQHLDSSNSTQQQILTYTKA
jgi:hypothetical protein